jgi:hypothetical protein
MVGGGRGWDDEFVIFRQLPVPEEWIFDTFLQLGGQKNRASGLRSARERRLWSGESDPPTRQNLKVGSGAGCWPAFPLAARRVDGLGRWPGPIEALNGHLFPTQFVA